jgi:Flp pilus assembly pilin Flp
MKTKRTRGAALPDYGILVGLIALGAVGIVATTGEEVADIYCTAADKMVKVDGVERQERCIVDPNDRITLEPDERFMDPETPTQMQSEFTDVMFAKTETGDRLIFSEFTEAPAESFWLDTALTSRNPHETERLISSCYMLGGGVDPICGAAGTSSAVSVPASATSMGYAISLSDNLDLPWQNDVAISIPATGSIEAQSWNIEVAREESDPIIEDVSVAFADHAFQIDDTDWTFGAFASIEGKFNRPLTLNMQHLSGPSHHRRVCYTPAPEADPICSAIATNSATVAIEVAPGAIAAGYQIQLPDTALGDDWVVEERLTLKDNNATYGTNDVTITRPNEAYQPGSLMGAFSETHTFAQEDTGQHVVQYVELSQPRNVAVRWEVHERNDHNYAKSACYKLADDSEVCSSFNSGANANIVVPTEAVSIGYKVTLPDTAVGPDETFENGLLMYGPEGLLLNQNQWVVRPNEEYQTGSLMGAFSETHTFAQEDTGQHVVQYVELSQPRNVELRWYVYERNSHNYAKAACYKLADDSEVCSSFNSGTTANIDVPIDAVSIGYKVTLPDTAVGPDTTFENSLQMYGPEGVLLNQNQWVVRPNEPYQTGTLMGSFSNHTFDQNDTGEQIVQYVDLSQPRNVELTWNVGRVDKHSYSRAACYKLSNGQEECSNFTNYYTASINVPKEAVSVGYKVVLPQTGVGPDTTFENFLQLYGGGQTLVSSRYTVTRPNEPYNKGSLAHEFTDPYAFENGETGLQVVEFINIEGDRNVGLTLSVNKVDNHSYSRQACYRLASGHEECTATNNYHPVSISVPVEAVAVGYKSWVPAPGNTYENYITLSGPGTGGGNFPYGNIAITNNTPQ